LAGAVDNAVGDLLSCSADELDEMAVEIPLTEALAAV
jgi:hypothetical protein